MRDLTGRDLDEVDPPPTPEELAAIRARAKRFYDPEFVDEVMTQEQVNAATLEADAGFSDQVPDEEGERS